MLSMLVKEKYNARGDGERGAPEWGPGLVRLVGKFRGCDPAGPRAINDQKSAKEFATKSTNDILNLWKKVKIFLASIRYL